jgi:PPOX class probable F420-dependent enzyme
MEKAIARQILELIDKHDVLALATLREDGWPQATTVAYASRGMTLYVATGADAQKVRNIRRDARVSLAIDRDASDWNAIQGLSMAATAEVIESASEIREAARLLKKKFPAMMETVGDPEHESGWAFLRITPKVISLIDYTRGFGHTVLVHA